MAIRTIVCLLASLLSSSVCGETVTVFVSHFAKLGDDVISLGEEITATTTTQYTTIDHPMYSGWIFTHWSLENAQSISNREESGKAKDRATFTVYEDTVAIANYLPISTDDDDDGFPDGHELYW